MTKNGRKVLWPLLVIGLLVLTAFTFAASGRLRRSNFTHIESADAQNLNNRGRVKRPVYVRRSNLSPRLNWNLNALGDRLEKPGRERLIVTATLKLAGDDQPQEVAAVFEYPDRLRLTVQKGNETRVMSGNGSTSFVLGIIETRGWSQSSIDGFRKDAKEGHLPAFSNWKDKSTPESRQKIFDKMSVQRTKE